MARRPKFFVELPRHAACLYAVEYGNGIVKIGRTAGPRLRMRTLYREALRFGHRVTRYHVSVVRDARLYDKERELIDRMTRLANPCRGRIEFFSHTRFEVARQLCAQVSRSA